MMQQKNPFKAFAVIFVLTAVMILGTLLINTVKGPTVLGTQSGTADRSTEESTQTQDINITVADSSSSEKKYTVAYIENTNLFSYFKTLQDQNVGFTFTYTDSSYGAFINSVNGCTTDTTKEFWEIMINGKSAEVGMSTYIVKPGDKIDLKISQIINY